MTKNHNPEMQRFLATNYHRLAYTPNYAFCVKSRGRVTAVTIENLDYDTLIQITYCEPNAESHGGYYGLRMNSSKKVMNLLLEKGTPLFDLGSYKEFENGFANYRANGNKGNRGDYFEDLFADLAHGTKPGGKTACFTDCGDVVVNGVHYQCKLYNATFTTTSTIEKTMKRLERVA